MDIKQLDSIENSIEEICNGLREDDANWVKDFLVRCIGDDDLIEQIMEMMVSMGYEDEFIKKTCKKVEAVQKIID